MRIDRIYLAHVEYIFMPLSVVCVCHLYSTSIFVVDPLYVFTVKFAKSFGYQIVGS